jgi:large subunit ribosomal protein L22
MKATASLPNLRISPRKVRLVTRALVGVDAREALVQLTKQTKKSSGPLHTLLQSAMANAVNNFGFDEQNLFVEDIRVGDGLTLKRWLPRAFGRATPLKRRGSRVTIILSEKIEGKDRRAPKENAPVVVEKAEAPAESEPEKEKKGSAPKPDASKKTSGPKPKAPAAPKKVFQRKAV